MPHYAQVVDGIVKQILVFDKDEDVAAWAALNPEGEWLATSYNTRQGVHYGADGQPDGGVALRFNYAVIGGRYDKERDAFYASDVRPSDAFYWDEEKLSYQLILPSKAANPSAGLNRSGNTHKVYVTQEGLGALGPLVRFQLAMNLNIEWVNDPHVADILLSVADSDTKLYAFRPEYKDIRPMTSRALWNLTDRLLQAKLHTPTLPAWRGRWKEEVEAIEGPFFVKRQRTHLKDTNPLNYTTWESAAAFLAAVPDSFWAIQSEPEDVFGEFIFQPVIAAPLTALELNLAVNKHSESYVFSQTLTTYEANNLASVSEPSLEDHSALIALIQQDVKAQGVKAGIHTLKFVQYNGQWTLLDWNTCLSGCDLQIYPSVYAVLDDPFLFMLGLPLQHRADNVYKEQRGYFGLNLGRTVEPIVGKAGLFPRWNGDVLQRVAGIGTSKREVTARFDALNEALGI